MVNEMTHKPTHLAETFVKLKSEFELHKIFQRNQNIKLSEIKDQGTSSKCIGCNGFDLIFQTATGIKVHKDLVQKEAVAPKELRCEHCIIPFSDLVVMKKHTGGSTVLLQYCTVKSVLYRTILYNTVLYFTVLYCTDSVFNSIVL